MLKQPDKKYKIAHHAVFSCQYHIVWATKYRRSVLTPSMQQDIKEWIKEKEGEYGYEVLEVEVLQDHVHLLAAIPPALAVTKVVGRIKGYTSFELKKKYPELKKRLPSIWTRSKFVSSAGEVSLEILKRYVENQKGV